MLDTPVCDEVLDLILPEPTEDEDGYVDDWAESQLY
jgi:hypothetical protein